MLGGVGPSSRWELKGLGEKAAEKLWFCLEGSQCSLSSVIVSLWSTLLGAYASENKHICSVLPQGD